MKRRVIARLDIKGPNLVKGIQLEGLRVLGTPEAFAQHYYESGADELLYMDVVSSLYGRNGLVDLVARTARDVFIPLTVGGGIRTLQDIEIMLKSGADKVAINTAAVKNPRFIKDAAQAFGSSTIVVAIEAIRQPSGQYHAFTDSGREQTGMEVLQWVRSVEDLGAGEIMITSVDREGTGQGPDTELVGLVAEAVNIPVLAHGGVGRKEHVAELLAALPVSGVCLASVLHYDFLAHRPAKDFNPAEGNTDFLRSGRANSRIVPSSMPEIKKQLFERGVPCRLPMGVSP